MTSWWRPHLAQRPGSRCRHARPLSVTEGRGTTCHPPAIQLHTTSTRVPLAAASGTALLGPSTKWCASSAAAAAAFQAGACRPHHDGASLPLRVGAGRFYQQPAGLHVLGGFLGFGVLPPGRSLRLLLPPPAAPAPPGPSTPAAPAPPGLRRPGGGQSCTTTLVSKSPEHSKPKPILEGEIPTLLGGEVSFYLFDLGNSGCRSLKSPAWNAHSRTATGGEASPHGHRYEDDCD